MKSFYNGVIVPTSVWTDFKVAYDGPYWVDAYRVGYFMPYWAEEIPATSPSVKEIVADQSALSGQSLRLVGSQGSNTLNVFSWPYPIPAANCDLLIGMKPVSVVSGAEVGGMVARFVASPSITYKSAHIAQAQAPVIVATNSGGTDTQPTSNTLTPGNWYWMRLNLNGNVAQSKVWARGSAEPGSFSTSQTSSRASAAGNSIGIRFNNRLGVEMRVDWLSYASDGTPAYMPFLG